MICQFCRKDEDLIDAHIYPKGFYKHMQKEKDNAIVFMTSPIELYEGKRYQIKQCGIYDSEILCGGCDNGKIGKWDEYAQQLLLNPFEPDTCIRKNSKTVGYKIENVDYVKLKLFFMSVLWRASITKNIFFRQVQLGDWEPVLRKMLQDANPGTENDFSVFLVKYDGEVAGEIMFSPEKIIKDVTYYKFKLAEYLFLIKVDRMPFPIDLRKYLLKPNQPLLIFLRNYEKSQELKIVKDLDLPNIPDKFG